MHQSKTKKHQTQNTAIVIKHGNSSGRIAGRKKELKTERTKDRQKKIKTDRRKRMPLSPKKELQNNLTRKLETLRTDPDSSDIPKLNTPAQPSQRWDFIYLLMGLCLFNGVRFFWLVFICCFLIPHPSQPGRGTVRLFPCSTRPTPAGKPIPKAPCACIVRM